MRSKYWDVVFGVILFAMVVSGFARTWQKTTSLARGLGAHSSMYRTTRKNHLCCSLNIASDHLKRTLGKRWTAHDE